MSAAAALALGLAIGLTLGAVGGGGSVLAVPALVYLLGEDVHAATTESLVVVTVAALAGGVVQARGQQVCWRHALAFAPAAVAGAVGGTVLNGAVSATALLVGFALVMMAAAVATWRRATRPAGEGPDAACPPLRTSRTIAAGAAVGVMTGLLGVGGGFLVVPLLALALRMPLRRAIGTSLVIVAFVSAVATGAHLVIGDGTMDAAITAAMALACAGGAVLGSLGSRRVPAVALARAFALVVAAVAVYVLAATAVVGAAPGR